MNTQTRDVYIAAVCRTPLGTMGGSLSSFPATKLGSIAIADALKRANIDPNLVDEVYMGNVLSAGEGQAPARQAALGAGINQRAVCTTINKVCASGTKAIILGAQSIMLGTAEVVVAGGMESMSNVPYYLPGARGGLKWGNGEIVDGIIKDGLLDVYKNYMMGNAAELIADDLKITREDQDTFAIQSYTRAQEAQKSGAFNFEIVPIEVPGAKGKAPTIIKDDEEPPRLIADKLRTLRPIFKSDGTVTAANASKNADGAAVVVLISGSKAKELGIPVIGKIRGWGEAAQAPEYFTTAPALAIPKALKHAGLKESEVDFFEVNEAFSAVGLANQKLLNLSSDKLNVNGGAVAIGHPLGCSGARIVVTLMALLHNRKANIGVAGVCNGGGGASALVIERVDNL